MANIEQDGRVTRFSRPQTFLRRLANTAALASTVLALTLAPTIVAAAGWKLAGPPNTPLTAVAFGAAAPNVIVAGRNGQLFSSQDFGATWKFVAGAWGPCSVDLPPPFVNVANPAGDYLTLNMCEGLYYSPDSEAFGRLSNGVLTDARLVSANPLNPSEIYAYAGGTLVYSTNRLTSYLSIVFPGPTKLFYVDWSAGNIFSAVGGTVYRLPVGQAGPWQTFSTGLPPGTVSAFAGGGAHLYLATSNGVYRSANQGLTWQLSLAQTATAIGAGDGSSMAAYAVVGTGLQTTQDGGQTWTALPALPRTPTVNNVVMSPSNPQQVVALTNRGLMQSSDGGQTFAAPKTSWQLPGAAALGVVTNATNAAQLFVRAVPDLSGAIDPALTLDGGTTWSYPTGPAEFDPGAFGPVPLQPLWASGNIAVASSTSVVNGSVGLYQSVDSGVTWTSVGSIVFRLGETTRLVPAKNGTTLYVYSNYDHAGTAYVEVYESVNSGATWTDLGYFSGTLNVARQRPDTGELLAGIDVGLYHSTNGLLWTAIGTGLPGARVISLAISPSTPTTMYAGIDTETGPAVFKSVDGGNTWVAAGTLIPNDAAKGLAVDPVSPNTVYAGFANGGVYRSVDGGVTWTSAAAGLFDAQVNELAFSLSDPHRLFASTPSGAFSVDTSVAPPSSAKAIEYYYPTFDHYFVTADPAEIAALDGGVFPGWVRTGETYAVETTVANGLNPSCRFFSASFAPKSSHFYTPYTLECNLLKAGTVWQFEGIVWQQRLRGIDGYCPPGFEPYYRLYNNGAGGAPAHRYTIKSSIVSQMQAQGWIVEGAVETNAFACVPQ